MGKLGMSGDDESSATLLDDSVADDDDDAETGGQKIIDNERQGVIYSWSFFHLVFAVAALYITMVLTDWNTIRWVCVWVCVGVVCV